MMRRSVKEILFGRIARDRYEGLPIVKNKLAGEELVYELEKIKSPAFKDYIKAMKAKITARKDGRYKFDKYKPAGMPKWAKFIAFFLPVIVVFSLGGWLLATRPDVTVQLRGEDARQYIEEQQGIVTNFSILNIILFIKYFWIDAVIERRIMRPQGLITKGR